MAIRKIKDAKDITSDELIYFKGHAQATYMSDGQTVEEKVSNLDSTINEIKILQGGNLKFFNLSASTWVEDSTYLDFTNRCDLVCEGVTPNMYAEVIFDVAQATSGYYAPVCETGEGIVSIWSATNTPINIPVIIITK